MSGDIKDRIKDIRNKLNITLKLAWKYELRFIVEAYKLFN